MSDAATTEDDAAVSRRALLATTSTVVPAAALGDGRVDHLVVPGDGAFVRLQARDAADRVVGESNPFWILRDEPPHGIPAHRRLRG